MVIWFESHTTSLDNEARVVSGHTDAPLSEVGQQQARELGKRYSDISSVWCSDLPRSYRTAELAFADRTRIHRDARLREIAYGAMTGRSIDESKKHARSMWIVRTRKAKATARSAIA